jgi:hypothetical protein
MKDVILGRGELSGKGVYANKDFKTGEVVIRYSLKHLSEDELGTLPQSEKVFVHKHRGNKYLYSEPERYVNHSEVPNTKQDLENGFDIAICDIKKGEMITTDATKDDID